MPHVLTGGRGRPPMPSGADVWSDGAVCRQEPLGGPCRRQSWPPPCPLAGRLVGVFRTVRQLAMRAVLHARPEVPLRRPIAFQRLREDDAWHSRQALEPLPEELVRSLRLPPALPEHLESMAVLIHRAPPTGKMAGIALRYGFFYGPTTWYCPEGAAADHARRREMPIVGQGEGVWSFVGSATQVML